MNDTLRAFVQLNASGKVIPGTLTYCYVKPKIGSWKEVELRNTLSPYKMKPFVNTYNGKPVPGSLVSTYNRPTSLGNKYREVCQEPSSCNIPTTTTTTTIAPTGWYLRSNYPDAPNNGDITFPDFTTGVATFNPNNVGNGDVAMIINRYDISGNPTIPDLTGLTNNLNTGTLTLSQGSNTIVYSFNLFSFIVTGGLNQIQIYYISIDSPASGDFNTIDPINVSVTITFPTTTTTTSTTTTSTTSTTSTTTTTTLNPTCAINWTVQNLDVNTYRNGDVIPEVQDPTAWAALTTGAWCWYNNDPANGAIYGKLYNWYAINDPRGLAPVGYHIPTLTEWTTLTNCLGGVPVAGNALKEAGTTHWDYPNSGDNGTGFTGLPGGIRDNGGAFYSKNMSGLFWCSTEEFLFTAWSCALYYFDSYVYINSIAKASGMSVRLIKD